MTWWMWLALHLFIVWIIVAVVFKTSHPIRYIGYRSGLLKPPAPPVHDYDRWDLEE